MKRRRPVDDCSLDPPPELVTFDPAEWSGRTDPERYEAFYAARREHLERHGWPGGELAFCVTLPDEPWTPV